MPIEGSPQTVLSSLFFFFFLREVGGEAAVTSHIGPVAFVTV